MLPPLVSPVIEPTTASFFVTTGVVLLKALWVPVLVACAIKALVVIVSTFKRLGK